MQDLIPATACIRFSVTDPVQISDMRSKVEEVTPLPLYLPVCLSVCLSISLAFSLSHTLSLSISVWGLEVEAK
jgi:hypothetical protein